MRILAIETSCDETACAIVEAGVRVASSVVASQVALHAPYGGIVPEVACRAHDVNLLPVVACALDDAGIDNEHAPDTIDAVAVTNRPGLIGALLIGLAAAKALAYAWKKPLIAIDHLEGHVYAAAMAVAQSILYGAPPRGLLDTAPERGLVYPLADADAATVLSPALRDAPVARYDSPPVSLVVSGGHTCLFASRAPTDHELLGQTQDDAVGEAFDKVAALLGLGYPGGPEIERVAEAGDAAAFAFPRSLLGDSRLAFSFSGLKTAVRYRVFGQDAAAARVLDHAKLSPDTVADAAASFQEAACDILAGKALQAVRDRGADTLLVTGGVAANSRLREKLVDAVETESRKTGKRVRVIVPPIGLCTDNAAFVAGLGAHHLALGDVATRTLDAAPRTRATRPKGART